MVEIGVDFEALEVGKVLGTSVNYVTRASIMDYIKAVEDDDPIFQSPEDAKAAGFEGVVAPPNFHLQYTAMKWATGQAGYVPQGSVHVRQKYKLTGLVYEGDCLTTTVSISDKFVKKERQYVVYRVQVTNQLGTVCISEFINMLP